MPKCDVAICRYCGSEIVWTRGVGKPPTCCKTIECKRAQRREIATRHRTRHPHAGADAQKRWRTAHPEECKRLRLLADNEVRLACEQRRRARKARALVEDVDRTVVFDNDGWVCGVCGQAVDPALVWPHPLSATLDHIIPIAVGGTHEYANVQLAHARCNASKGARL